MEFIPLIAQLVALTASIALIWLVVRAFKKHPGWGFTVLLLSPPGAMAFGIKYWQEEKQAFLAYLFSFCMAVSLGVYMFMTWGGAGMIRNVGYIHQGIQSRTPSKTDAANFMHTSLRFINNADAGHTEASNTEPTSEPQIAQADVATDAAQTAEQAPEAVATLDEPVEKKKKPVRTRLTYVPIMVSDADKYVGHTVKVTRRNVPEKEYRLTGVSPRYLEFTQKIGGGSYSFQYKDTDIEKIRVLVNQPY
jgi:hypothetical protein